METKFGPHFKDFDRSVHTTSVGLEGEGEGDGNNMILDHAYLLVVLQSNAI